MNLSGIQKRAIFLLFLLLINAGIYYELYRENNQKRSLVVSFLDIGQGDALFIQTPGGAQMLIDGGKTSKILSQLAEVMPALDRDIDVVVSTHPDADHSGGLSDVLSRYRVQNILRSPAESDTATWKNLKSAIDESGARQYIGKSGGEIIFDGGKVKAEILWPPAGTPKGAETNWASIVMRVVYGENEFLLTGDAPSDVEKRIIASKQFIESDVLKAGHHGSKTSSSKEFLEAVSPEYGIISAGRGNTYGHPHTEVLERFRTEKIKILRTDEEGRITFTADGENISVKTEK